MLRLSVLCALLAVSATAAAKTSPGGPPPLTAAPAAAGSLTGAGGVPIAAGGAAFANGGLVEALPQPTPNAGRAMIETKVWSAHHVSEIRARVGSFVNIEVPDPERIEGFFLSDTTVWRFLVSEDRRRVMVKAGREGSTNSGTMVTSGRVYELSFTAVANEQPWHQTVRWTREEPQRQAWGIFERATPGAVPAGAAPAAGLPTTATASASPVSVASEIAVDASRVNFNWRVSGEAAFRPSVVFDDGTFTYIRLPRVQDMPVLLAIDQGQMRMVDYAVRGDMFVVPRISDGFVLRLGAQQVNIERVMAP